MVAEVGFEPHDLRVMSPTSYQAALLRDILLSSHSQGLLYHTFVLLSTPFLLFVQKILSFCFFVALAILLYAHFRDIFTYFAKFYRGRSVV